MRSSELIPILLLLSIPAQLLGVIVFQLLTSKKGRRVERAPKAQVVPFKIARVRQ